VWVADGEVVDASPVIGPALRIAQLDGNRLATLPALAGLPITRLSASRNPLSSLAGVAGCALQELFLPDTLVGDLAPLGGMATLKRLDLGGTPVADLAPLRGLQLDFLILARTAVRDLAPLAGMPLTYLDVSRSPIASLAPLAGGSARLNLDASASAITDLTPLRGRDVWRLMIHDTGVRDLAPLAGSKLESLGLARTKVSDLAPLAGCPLAKLDLAEAPVTDLTVLGAAPLRELNLAGHVRGSLQPLIGKDFDLLVLPPGPYTPEQLGQFPRLKARELRLDPADAAQWAAAEQVQGVARINGLERVAALVRRDACLALLAGRACELKTLVEPLPELRLVLLPILATREEAGRLAALAGGRLPCVGDPARYRQLTVALYRALARSDAPIQVGVASGSDGQPVWLDGHAWTAKPMLRHELALLAAGGTTVFDVNRPYEVQPADTRTVLAIELP
jgi:Leucine-rich repeat (LRR) protein